MLWKFSILHAQLKTRSELEFLKHKIVEMKILKKKNQPLITVESHNVWQVLASRTLCLQLLDETIGSAVNEPRLETTQFRIVDKNLNRWKKNSNQNIANLLWRLGVLMKFE